MYYTYKQHHFATCKEQNEQVAVMTNEPRPMSMRTPMPMPMCAQAQDQAHAHTRAQCATLT